MNDLVQRLSVGEHVIEAGLRPARTAIALKEALDRGYVHVRFTGTRGGTELGIPVNGELSQLAADYERGTGSVKIVGDLTLDFVRVRCHAALDLETLTGSGHLEVLEAGIGAAG